MKSILRRRPSPALVISMIALFVSLSGVSYGVATGFIDSREIKNNEIRSLDIRNNQIRTRDLRNNEVRGIDIRNSTVQGRDIALNTLTGEDVKEDTLGKVPSAGTADSATTAGGVNTLKIIPQTTLAEGATPVTLATHGPLTLSGECAAGPRCAQAQRLDDRGRLGRDRRTSTPRHAAPRLPGRRTSTPRMAASGRTIWPAGTTQPRLTVVAASPRYAPSGKGFSGAGRRCTATPSGAGSCRFHGSLALQG